MLIHSSRFENRSVNCEYEKSRLFRWNDVVHNVHSSDPNTNEWTHAIFSQTPVGHDKVSTVVLKTTDVQAMRNENAILKQRVDVLQRKTNKLKQV